MNQIKEKFIPIQIEQNICIKCERCVRACKNKAINFKNGVRYINYIKCKGCFNCIQVCPRNAITVISSEDFSQNISINIDPEKCNLCEICIDKGQNFCPQKLFYKYNLKNSKEMIKIKKTESITCKGCLNCVRLCPEDAISYIFKI